MDRIYLVIFKVFQFIVKHSPSFIINNILDFLAFIAYLVNKKHRKIAQVNLDLAFGNRKTQEQKEEIIKRCYRNILYNLAEFVKNQGATKEEILEKVVFKNEDFLLDAIKEKRKVIVTTAHYGNWELMSLAIAAKFSSVSIVGRDLDSNVMNEILKDNREQFDIELISKDGAMKGMMKALKQNRTLGILVDQNTAENEGLLIDFFDKKARHTPSAAILARKFDAIIIPCFIKTDDFKSYEVSFYEPIQTKVSEDKDADILNSVKKQADITQKIIEEKPDEWFWLHQRWKNQYESLYNA